MNINFEYKPTGSKNPTLVTLTARCDNDVLLVQRLDISRITARGKYIDHLTNKYSALSQQADTIDSQLQQIAARLITEDDKTCEPAEQDRIDENSPIVKSEQRLQETDQKLLDCAKEFVLSENLAEFIIRHIEYLGLVGEPQLALCLYVVNTSRLLNKPLAAIVMGTSSSGKSFSISTVSKLFPDEAILQAHRLTPAALNYMPVGSLIHRSVVAGERSRKQDDDVAETTRSLREMLSDGVLRLMSPSRDPKTGEIKTSHVSQPGPISYIESTTLGLNSIFAEDRTRLLIFCANESADQSRRIVERLAHDAKACTPQNQTESIIVLHHTVQRLLKPHTVTIPFADKLTNCIPADRVEVRRVFRQLLSLIEAVTLLHQYQRRKDNNGNLIAQIEDYNIVKKYMTEPLSRSLGVSLTAGAERLKEAIEEKFEFEDNFTASELKETTGLGSVVYDRLHELRAAGIVEIIERALGSSPAKYRINPYPAAQSGLELPEL